MNGVCKYNDRFVAMKGFYFNGKRYGLHVNKFKDDSRRSRSVCFDGFMIICKQYNPYGYITYDIIINKREIKYIYTDYDYLCYIHIHKIKENKIDIIHKNCLLINLV